MIEKQYKILHLFQFSETTNWNIKQLFSEKICEYNFDVRRIGSIIKRRKDALLVENDEKYKRLTIKTKNEGVVVRDIVYGRDIKTKKQFYIHEGQLAISKIDARNGAFGIVPKEAEGAIITENFWAFDVEEKQVNIEYLVLVLSTCQFVQSWLECSNGSGNRLYLNIDLFLNYKIPFPSKSEQDEIVSKYNTALAEAEQNKKAAKELEENVDKYLLGMLGIDISEGPQPTSEFLQFTSFNKLFKWDVTVNLNKINPKDVFRSKLYKNVPITALCEINPATNYPNEIEEISFLPMECISNIYGEIIFLKDGTTNAKGYTKFMENDILWAKITPCMQNGKCAIAKCLKNGYGYGSTEYHVFRAIEGKAIPEYLYCFLRTNLIRKVAQSYFTGSAGQQRVGTDFIENLTLPFLPIASNNPYELTQKKIVAHIFELKSKIKAHRQKAEELRQFAKRQFEEAVFGDNDL